MANQRDITIQMERYINSDIRNSLSTPERYPLACKEIDVLLHFSYTKLPKPIQFLLFDDTLFAFRCLPLLQTQSAVSTASVLIQSAEADFRKQKRALAATEFKQAMIALKRRAKILHNDKGAMLYHNASTSISIGCGMLLQMTLWELQYNNYFGDSESISKTKQHWTSSEMCSNANLFDGSENTLKTVGKQHAPSSALGTNINRLWKYDFKEAYLALPYKFAKGFCLRCKSSVWLNSQCRRGQHPLQPFSLNEIGRYISVAVSHTDKLHAPWLL